MRTDYAGGLVEEQLAGDWSAQFGHWLGEAVLVILIARFIPLLGLRHTTAVSLKQERSRSARRPLWERFFLDFLLLVPAGYAYWVLHSQLLSPVEDAATASVNTSQGHPVGDPVQPAGQGVPPADGRGPAGQDQEGGLHGVLDVLRAAQQRAAGRPDQPAVPARQGGEGRLVAVGHEPPQQLGVGPLRGRVAGEAAEVTDDGMRLPPRHGWTPGASGSPY